jgi:hypothetical protein
MNGFDIDAMQESRVVKMCVGWLKCIVIHCVSVSEERKGSWIISCKSESGGCGGLIT